MEEKKLQELKELAASTKIDVVRNLLSKEDKKVVIGLYNLFVVTEIKEKEKMVAVNSTLDLIALRNVLQIDYNVPTSYSALDDLAMFVKSDSKEWFLKSFSYSSFLKTTIYYQNFVKFVIALGFYNSQLSHIAVDLAI